MPLAGALVLMGLVLVWAGWWMAPARAEPRPYVWVDVDGQPRYWGPATAAWPGDMLTAIAGPWWPSDEARINGLPLRPDTPWPADAAVVRLSLRRARAVTVLGPRGRITLWARENPPARELVQRGWALHPADGFQTLRSDLVRWRPAATYTVRTPTRAYTARGHWATTADLLATLNLAVLPFTETSPALPEPPSPETAVQIRYGTPEWQIQLQAEPFSVRWEPAPDALIDTVVTKQEGQVGLRVRAQRTLTWTTPEGPRTTPLEPVWEWVLQPPRDRILGYGTRIEIRTLETPDGPVRYWRAVKVYATSYSPCRLGIDGCDDITASGERLRKGIIAVTLPWYRWMKGWRVYVPGYGFGIIADVGGGIPGRHWIDLGFSDDDYEPWHQWTTLYFVAPPPPPEQIPYILP